MKDEKIKTALSEDDRNKVEKAVDEVIQWLDSHSSAEAEDYKNKQKELEAVFHPIMTKMYQNQGAQGAQG